MSRLVLLEHSLHDPNQCPVYHQALTQLHLAHLQGIMRKWLFHLISEYQGVLLLLKQSIHISFNDLPEPKLNINVENKRLRVEVSLEIP